MSKCFTYVWVVLAVIGMTSLVGRADEGSAKSHHQELQGVVVEKGGTLAVKVSNGATYQLNENRAERHGHVLPKAGDEVTVVIDENNMVLEVHPKGTEGKHRFVTGEVVSIGTMQHEITLKTAKGEQKFPLEKQVLSASIKDGAWVRARVERSGPHRRCTSRKARRSRGGRAADSRSPAFLWKLLSGWRHSAALQTCPFHSPILHTSCRRSRSRPRS